MSENIDQKKGKDKVMKEPPRTRSTPPTQNRFNPYQGFFPYQYPPPFTIYSPYPPQPQFYQQDPNIPPPTPKKKYNENSRS